MPHIAIIGAGLSGLLLAHRLSDHAQVTVIEKSRGVGGRMSTRRADAYRFDHGAQYMTARGAEFRAFLDSHLEAGHVARWSPRLISLPDDGAGAARSWTAPRYVAQPGMNSLCKAMAEGHAIRLGIEVATVTRKGEAWALGDTSGDAIGTFDWVLSTAPSVQTQRLLPQSFSGQGALAAARMMGCYSLMIGLARPLDLTWDAAEVRDAPLAWIAVNSAKPGREGPQSILCQTSNAWAQDNLDRDQAQVRAEVLECFEQVTGLAVGTPQYLALHRWRYASVARDAGQPYLLDAAAGLAACGDWCGAGKVEAAFDSASGLARAIADHIG